ncbi:hypothetical protein ABZ079_35590 [Streptomyces sp. NPDC006314]|uniref:hypothetical protein n=1 Tax=Streptomyces sp. NPDC006314 TaxID=3154475 RepID=UPI0033B82A15
MSPIAAVVEANDIFDLDIEFLEAEKEMLPPMAATQASCSIGCSNTGGTYTCYCSYVPTQCGYSYGVAGAAPAMCPRCD